MMLSVLCSIQQLQLTTSAAASGRRRRIVAHPSRKFARRRSRAEKSLCCLLKADADDAATAPLFKTDDGRGRAMWCAGT